MKTKLTITVNSEEGPSFTERWRGEFRAASRDDSRYDALAGKYL